MPRESTPPRSRRGLTNEEIADVERRVRETPLDTTTFFSDDFTEDPEHIPFGERVSPLFGHHEVVSQSQPPISIRPSQPTIWCANCDAVITSEEDIHTYLEEPICENCYESEFTECDDCGYLIRNRRITYAGERPICPDCIDDYRECDSCHEMVRRDDTITDDNNTYCEDCYHDHLRRCIRCRQIFDRSDLTYDDEFDGYFCDTCYPFRNVHQYGHRPDDLKHIKLRGEDTKLFFGVENEIIGGDINKYDFNLTHMLKFWETHDRSVYPGFEFKTYPLSYNYILKNRPFDQVCAMAKCAGYVSDYTDQRSSEFITDTEIKKCGLHIHLSRNAFEEWESNTRLHSFIYLFERFWKEVVVFSRRKHDFRIKGGSNSIDQWAARFDEFDSLGMFESEPNAFRYKSYYRVVDKVLNRYRTGHEARRHVVNLENHNTVEVRIFQGCLDPEIILASIQLVKYFFELSLFDIPNLEKMHWRDIKQWATEQYPEFVAHCERMGI